MKRKGTILALLCFGVVLAAQAQPVRNGVDVIWALDVAGAEMTLDGRLDEAVWERAEQIPLVWNGEHPLPGSGQRTETAPTLTEPSDPNNGVIRVLRDGNTIWLSATVQDASVGGSTGLWGMDGLIMNILDRTRLVNERVTAGGIPETNFFQGNRTEFFYSWWNGADTTDATTTYSNGLNVGSGRPLPGVAPRFHGFYGGPSAIEPRTPQNVAVWDGVTVVDGIANDDTHGPDVGYTMEMRIDAAALGYDFDKPGGDKLAWNVALQDQDYNWPSDPNLSYLSRVWWQNQWGNNFNEGIGYIYGSPDATVNTATPSATAPEFTVASGVLLPDPVVDGALDDLVWERVDPAFTVQYQASQELLSGNPEVAKYYVFYFRPSVGGQNTALVVDPSIARFKMFFKGTKLYVGVDVEDQAVSGVPGEDGRDGIRFFLRDRDSLTTAGTLFTRAFEVSVDSAGNARLGADALTFQTERPGAFEAAVALKGNSTPADPSDVDEGYQIEMVIDLPLALGYPDDLGDHMIWTAMNFFDGDFLDTDENSYAMRTWIVAERSGQGSSIYGYLDPNAQIGTSREASAEVPGQLELLGNYPNPFNPATTLRYALPYAGDVTVQVFDVLGRRVTTLAAGPQGAGRQEVRFDATGLASGMYLYRVAVTNPATGTLQTSATGRLVLLK